LLYSLIIIIGINLCIDWRKFLGMFFNYIEHHFASFLPVLQHFFGIIGLALGQWVFGLYGRGEEIHDRLVRNETETSDTRLPQLAIWWLPGGSWLPPVGAHGVTGYIDVSICLHICMVDMPSCISWMHVSRIRECALCDVWLTSCLVAWNFVQSVAVIKLKTYLASSRLF